MLLRTTATGGRRSVVRHSQPVGRAILHRPRCCNLHVCCTLCASCSLLAHVVQQSCWMATLYAALEECSGNTWPQASGCIV